MEEPARRDKTKVPTTTLRPGPLFSELFKAPEHHVERR